MSRRVSACNACVPFEQRCDSRLRQCVPRNFVAMIIAIRTRATPRATLPRDACHTSCPSSLPRRHLHASHAAQESGFALTTILELISFYYPFSDETTPREAKPRLLPRVLTN
jgi:hypothetical protein